MPGATKPSPGFFVSCRLIRIGGYGYTFDTEMCRALYRLLSFVIAMCFAIACAVEAHRHATSGPCLQCLFEDAERRRGVTLEKRLESVAAVSIQSAQQSPKTPDVRLVVPFVAAMVTRPNPVLAQRVAFQSANQILGPPPRRPTEPSADVGAPRAPPVFE